MAVGLLIGGIASLGVYLADRPVQPTQQQTVLGYTVLDQLNYTMLEEVCEGLEKGQSPSQNIASEQLLSALNTLVPPGTLWNFTLTPLSGNTGLSISNYHGLPPLNTQVYTEDVPPLYSPSTPTGVGVQPPPCVARLSLGGT